jgi:methylated-DNA-[protein]-cysteine S-methyltransferase
MSVATVTSYRTVASPVGPLTLAGHDEVLTHLRMEDQAHPPPARHDWVPDGQAFPKVAEQLEAYFAGELTTFDVPFDLEGTPFQRQVWSALCEIPYGTTASYGDVARRIGRPTAYRAVGLANGRNPVAIIVPCHRVIGSSGTLTGYGGGLDRKRVLLDLERGVAPLG